MKTWNHRGTHYGYKTKIMRYSDGAIAIFQSVEAHDPGDVYSPKVDVIRINEQELRDILNDKKKFPRSRKPKKQKRGKK